jgi:hypothetical protein
MDPGAAAEATRRYFRELPRVIHRVCGDWASRTHVALRQSPIIPGEARRTIHGKAVRRGGESFARVWCESPIGGWLERGTGIYGPYKRPIRAKGGSYVDAHGTYRTRRMLRWKGTVWGVSGKWASGQTETVASGGRGVTYRTRKKMDVGASYKASAGYIFAYEVKGMKPTPWFYPLIQKRVPLFERSLRATMAAATEAIRNGGVPFRTVIQFG